MRITRLFVLLALAALLAPRVEASRTSVWGANPPASIAAPRADAAGLLASLASAATADAEPTAPPLFNLGDVVLVERELEREEHFNLGPLTLVDLNLLRGPPPSYPETRVGGFELLPPFRVGASPSLSLWPRQACGFSCREVVSDSREDPWGLQARARPAGIPPIRLAPPSIQEPVPVIPGQKLNPWAKYDVSPQYLAPGAPPESLDALRAAMLGAIERNRTEARGGAIALGGRTADELSADEQEDFVASRSQYRRDPAFRAAVDALKGRRTPAAAAGGTGGEEPPDDFVITPWGTRDLRTGKFTKGPRGGMDPVQDFIEHARENGFEVLGKGEISVETPFGVRRPDTVLRNPATGRVGGVELKSTPEEFAKTNPSQAASDRYINTFGARAVGKNAEEAGIKELDYMMKIQWPPR